MAKLRGKKRRGQTNAATAFHRKSEDSTHIVGIGNLRVVILQDGNVWFAQGLEIDYAAQAESLAKVKKAFEDGLSKTVHENLRAYGSIEHLLKPAPTEIWKEVLSAGTQFKRYSQITMHRNLQQNLPFKAIDYLQKLPKAA